MPSLKDIRIRIASVKSTRKITSAMKVVSAAKFHKAQDAQSHFQRYVDAYQYALGQAMHYCPGYDAPLMGVQNPDAPVVLLLLTSNSSLCGAYNSSVASLALAEIYRLRQQAESQQAKSKRTQAKDAQPIPADAVKIYTFGRKGYDTLKREGVIPVENDTALVDKPSFQQAAVLFDSLATDFLAGRISGVRLCYNRFRTAASQEPVVEPLLPVTVSLPQEALTSRVEYIFEPSAEQFFNYALPQYAKLLLYTSFMNNFVGEHGARMTAMTQATDNADSLIDELTLAYNKARQTAITNEILEIVSGADALKNT